MIESEDERESFNPSRLVLARRRRGLTMTSLAKLIDVDVRSMSAYEAGQFSPEADRLQLLATVLHFPANFFYGDDLETLSPHAASFRAMSKIKAGHRDMALGAGTIALLLNQWIEAKFQLPTADVPDLGHEARNPEAAADSVRRCWGLGELPIKNVIHLLESRGVRVFSLAIDAVEVDAFSMWRDGTPFVFLNTKKSAEHGRYDAAHELGHLVLHRHGAPYGQNAEREANAFASAFLMPRSSVLAHAPRLATLSQLIRLKRIWIVSVAALVYRLHAVGLLTDWHYRTLCIELASRGYRKHEPEEAPREASQVLAKVFAVLRDEGITKPRIAAELRIPQEEIEQLVFGLTTMTSLTGAGKRRSAMQKPTLRVVRSVGEGT